MKSIIAIVFLFGTACVVMSQKPVKPKEFNIDAMLVNNRVLTNYLNCLLDKGPCTKESNGLKKMLPDAIQTDCSKCTPDQKRNSKKIMNFLRTRRPADWVALSKKYDPQGLFKKRLDAGLY